MNLNFITFMWIKSLAYRNWQKKTYNYIRYTYNSFDIISIFQFFSNMRIELQIILSFFSFYIINLCLSHSFKFI